MKFFLVFKVAAFTAAFLSVNKATAQTSENGKILIVYITRTNNTKAIAEIIQKHVGGKLVAHDLAQVLASAMARARLVSFLTEVFDFTYFTNIC